MIESKQPIRTDEMGCLGSWLIFVLDGWSALGLIISHTFFRDVICVCVVQAGLLSSFIAFFSLRALLDLNGGIKLDPGSAAEGDGRFHGCNCLLSCILLWLLQ